MCGIAGCYQQPNGQKLTDVMTDRIAHRGPDASGVWSHGDDRVSVQLGHRRLSIIDLSAAADQPLSKHGLTLVYNGELYNFRELRAELARRGVSFVTTSDTEVVLEAWRLWGAGALRRFRGMFAFALADEATGELVLARDPLGIKPLYYLPRGDGLLFASELKALVAAVGPELRIEPGALVASMLYYWVPEQWCAIEGVRKLPAGSWARIRPDGRLHLEHYWRIAEVAEQATGDPAPDLGRVIEDSVAAHLVADVPVSSFLSGGLDSSIITVLAHRAAQEIDAYTITFRPEDQRLEAMPDDAVYARKVAQRFGVTLHEIEISPDIVDLLPRIVDALDEPIGDPAAINTLLMCQAARERGVKVILSGMGADELFGGYRKHLACLMASRYRQAACRRPGRRGLRGRPVPGQHPGPGPAVRSVGETFPHVRQPARGAAVPAQLHPVRPGRARRPGRPGPGRVRRPGHQWPQRHLQRQLATRRGQPDVPGRRAAVPARAQPGLHGPVEHGGFRRGPCPVRRSAGDPGGVRRQGQ